MSVKPRGIIAAVLIALVAAACSSSSKSSSSSSGGTGGTPTSGAATGTPIKIMQIATLTGPSDNVPDDAAAGKAAAKAINAAGGVNGHPIDLEVCDDKFDPNAAAACARQAVSDKVAAVVALNSAFGGNVIPIIAAANIPSVGDNLLGAAEITSKDVFPIDGGGITGSSAMAYADALAGGKTLRPVLVDVAAAKGLLPFIQGVTKLFPGIKMLPDVDVPAQATDVTSQASAATAGGADGAFFVVGQGAAAPLTRAMRTAGFTGYLSTSTQSITDQEIKDLGSQATGLLLVSAMPPPSYTQNPTIARFDKDMRAAGITARTGGMELAWASVTVAAMGLAKATTMDGPGLIQALNGYGEFNISGLGQWDYTKPLQSYAGGALRLFNPFSYISKVNSSGIAIPISPQPYDVTMAPSK
jgi:ABC-type branched-subunit amino acid transport system substrate-binding protein